MPASACAGICEDCEMSSTRQLNETMTPGWRLQSCSGWRVVGQSGIADSVGKCQQIVGAWLGLLLDGNSDHFPTAGRRQCLGMRLAKVIAMWFDLVCQGAQNRRGIAVGVSQCGGGWMRASCPRTSARPHLPDATPRVGWIVGSAPISGYRVRLQCSGVQSPS
jgi:hypothetical protein